MIIRLYFLQPMSRRIGSFDIFYAERLNDTWQKWSDPINLGSKINTSGAEKSLVFWIPHRLLITLIPIVMDMRYKKYTY